MVNPILITIICSSIFNYSMGGTLTGRIFFDGKLPKQKTLKMDADPVCGSAHNTPVYRQSFIINNEGALKNVVVYLKQVNYDGKIPEAQAVIDQKGCLYDPHVQNIMVGQELLIKNSDATLHNIHGLPSVNPEFNFAMPRVVKEKSIKFEKKEHHIKIKCDVHSWMKSYLSVFDHPYFSVTDDTGYYKIDNIPPGTYEIIAWQEKFRDKETKEWKTLNATVTISDGDAKQNFTFIREAKKK